MKLTKADLQQVEQAVREAETKTRGEIVPVLLSRSSPYSDLPWVLGLAGAAAAGLSSFLVHEVLGPGWILTIKEFSIEMLVGLLLGWTLARVPAIARRALGTRRLDQTVRERALAEFTRNGVMNTHDRCGTLLLVALFEHRVVILGDRGIHEIVGDSYWSDEVRRITSQIQSDSLASALSEGIHRLGELMGQKFPPNGQPRNEIANRLRTDLA